jgi:flavine halogenase
MGARLSETELQKSLDFCVSLFNPTTPEQHERVARGEGLTMKMKSKNGERQLDAKALLELMDVSAPVVDPAILEDAMMISPDIEEEDGERDEHRIRNGVQPFGRFPGTRQTSGPTLTFRDRSHSESFLTFTSRDRSTSSSSTSSTSSEAEKAIETQLVLHKINARRVVQSEYGINNLESEPLNGLVVRLERGKLGLMPVAIGNGLG